MNIAEKARALKAKLSSRNTTRSTIRKRLRGPTNLQFALADSIALLNAEAWDGVAADAGFFLSREYLAALETVLPDNIAPRYALIVDGMGADAVPVAAVVMQLIDIQLEQVRPEKSAANKKWLSPLTDKVAERVRQRALVCGNLLIFGQYGIAFAPGVDAETAWHAVAEVMYRVRQTEALNGKIQFAMIKDLHAPFIAQAKYLEHLSYRYVETEPNMVLSLGASWKNYDDYLASLASKYRANVRNGVLKPFDAAGLTVRSITDMAAHEAVIHDLYKQVQMNADVRPFLLPSAYFAVLQRAAAARCRATGVFRGSQMLGFLISIGDGETAVAYHIGFDREAAEHAPIYLRLLHAGIADAIALGCKRVSFGRTALEPKAALGAKPEPFGVLLRHRQPVLNKLMKRMLLGIEHADAPERNPFKKEAA